MANLEIIHNGVVVHKCDYLYGVIRKGNKVETVARPSVPLNDFKIITKEFAKDIYDHYIKLPASDPSYINGLNLLTKGIQEGIEEYRLEHIVLDLGAIDEIDEFFSFVKTNKFANIKLIEKTKDQTITLHIDLSDKYRFNISGFGYYEINTESNNLTYKILAEDVKRASFLLYDIEDDSFQGEFIPHGSIIYNNGTVLKFFCYR